MLFPVYTATVGWISKLPNTFSFLPPSVQYHIVYTSRKNGQIHINMSTYWHMQQCKSTSWLSLCSCTMLQPTHCSCWQVYPSLTFLPQQPSQSRYILATEKWTVRVKKKKRMNHVHTWHNLVLLHSHSVWEKKTSKSTHNKKSIHTARWYLKLSLKKKHVQRLEFSSI